MLRLTEIPALTNAALGTVGRLAGMALGTVAALLSVLALSCSAELNSTPSPAATASIPLVQIEVGQYGQCGLPPGGRAVCNHSLGLPAGLADAQFRQVSVGQGFACGLRRDETIACWGDNDYSKAMPPPGQFALVSAGEQHACALDIAGYAQCWGRDQEGRATPPAGIGFTAIAAGGSHSCGLTIAGGLQCWGSNNLGQADDHSGPFQSLSLGTRHTCVLRPEGAAWCQGDNAAGQSRPPPGVFTQIAAGEYHTCGLRPGGQPECWGGDFGAALAEPAGEFTVISGGRDTFCALTAEGYPRCWRYLPGSPQAAATATDFSTVAATPATEFSAAAATPATDPSTATAEPTTDPSAATPPPAIEFSAAVAEPVLRLPVELFPWPGGGLAAVERAGIILCFSDVRSQCAAETTPPLLDLTDRTDLSTPESGMLSAALDPDFDQFPFLYVYYTVQGDPRKVRLSRFPVADGRIDRAGELVILELPMPNGFHFGGAVRFGPEGMLYLGIGENQFKEDAQSLESRRGKIIRIDVRGASEEQPYRAPADNPFQGTAAARPEIWAYGLRNPWRMSFDAAGLLWVGDVGEASEEEVSIARAGANLGWPLFEGNFCHGGEGQCADLRDYAPPLATYGREEGCAIIWGGQYRGAAAPQLVGSYIFGDYCSGRVWALTPDGAGGWQRQFVAQVLSAIISFGTDSAGEMYALAVNQPPLKLGPLSGAAAGAESPAAEP